MARQHTRTGGKAANTITYERYGKTCVRSKQSKVRQTPAMKKRSSNFAIASKAARISWLFMAPLFTRKDGTRYIRLTGAFSSWLKGKDLENMTPGEMDYVKGFVINPEKQVGNKWGEHISVTRNDTGIQITILQIDPAVVMTLPKHTAYIKITIASLFIGLPEASSYQAVSSSLTINCNKVFSATNVQHDLDPVPGSVILCGYNIECLDAYLHTVPVRKKFCLPGTIVYADWVAV